MTITLIITIAIIILIMIILILMLIIIVIVPRAYRTRFIGVLLGAFLQAAPAMSVSLSLALLS